MFLIYFLDVNDLGILMFRLSFLAIEIIVFPCAELARRTLLKGLLSGYLIINVLLVLRIR